jgi:hypothetical protein
MKLSTPRKTYVAANKEDTEPRVPHFKSFSVTTITIAMTAMEYRTDNTIAKSTKGNQNPYIEVTIKTMTKSTKGKTTIYNTYT